MDNKAKIEKEIRFYFPAKKLNFLKNKLRSFKFFGSYYELTKMYNNPNPVYDFYNSKIDGRLRLRHSISLNNKTKGFGLLSWKQRIPEHFNDLIRKEKEVEFSFSVMDVGNVNMIIEEILKCPLVSSYERRRHYYTTNKMSITLDEFPFGLMLEFEFKKAKISNFRIDNLLENFNLKIASASILSCDDMYRELCFKNDTKPNANILFTDKNMPHL